MDSRIVIFAILFLAVGCVATTKEQAVPLEVNQANTTEKVVPTEPPPPPPEEKVEETPVVEEEPAEEIATLIIETRPYIDPKNRISLDYPKEWALKTENLDGTGSLTAEFIDTKNYPTDKIRISYAKTAKSLDEEKKELESHGAKIAEMTINEQEFISYDIILQPLPGKKVKERVAIAIKGSIIYRIALTAKMENFDALVPYYNVTLNSVWLLE